MKIPNDIALIIQEEIESDLYDENYKKKADKIRMIWNDATDEQKTSINDILICLSGWAMDSLCKKSNMKRR